MNKDRLNELLSSFPSRRIAVIGDFFLDKYLDFDPELAEISLETGKTANQVVNIRHSPGAAGSIVSNLTALGAGEVVLIGFTGEDGEGYELRRDLYNLGCNMDYLLSVRNRRTPTYLKPRNCRIPSLDGESERYDTKNRESLPTDIEQALMDLLQTITPQVDAVIVGDQAEEEECGVITTGIRDALARITKEYPQAVFWVDSRRRIGLFGNVIIKPNQHEGVKAAFPDHKGQIDDELVMKAGRELLAKTGKPVFLTRAERGMLVFGSDGCAEVRGVRVEEPTDPTGAGDSATAAAVLTLASGGTLEEAALLANLAASITIQQLGVTGTASQEEIRDRLEIWHAQK